jgi:hypothetical protein
VKILFDNVLKNATLTSTNGSVNYPPENLVHNFLRKIYRSNATEYDTITITLDDYKYINSFFVGYTDTVKIVLRLYQGATLLKTETLENVATTERITTDGSRRETTSGAIRIVSETFDYASVHWDTDYYVSSIQLDVYGGANIYVGGVGAGQAWTSRGPMSPWDEPFIDSTQVVTSPYGQTIRNEALPLNAYMWTFRDLTREQTNELQDIYRSKKLGALVWVDAFEENHDFKKPFYAFIADPFQIRKNGRRYDVLISLQEAG